MPTYSYRCADCDHAFDIHQAFTDDNLTICPNCGGKLRKIFSPVGVSFSGSGFYRNDSRADAQKSKSGSGSKSEGSSSEGSKSDAPAKSDAAPKSESKSDSSSSPKKESKPAGKKEKAS